VSSATILATVLAAVTMPAGAQVTSEQRIPVRKESGGDVARRDSIARADSIANAARRDSLAMLQARNDSLERANAAYRDSVDRAVAMVRDSMARAELARVEAARADSVARADSIRNAAALAAAAAAAIPPALSRRGFYFGLGGGWSSPQSDWGEPYSDGWNVTVPFGWQPMNSRFGIRADIAYDSHGGESFIGTAPPLVPVGAPTSAAIDFDDAAIWSGNLDVTADLFQWGANKLSSLYLLGGVGVHFFDAARVTVTPTTGQPSIVEGDSQTEFGFNGGAGIGFGIGRASLFLESRYFTASHEGVDANWVPVIVGIRWF
jgi:opacity protein-like surface antigen